MVSNVQRPCLIASGVTLIIIVAVAWTQPVWPTFQHDNQRTGRSRHVGPNSADSVWSFTAGGDIYLSSPVIAEDGTIYFGCIDSNFYAVNPDGSLKWTVTTGGAICATAAIGLDGTIYISSNDLNVYAIEDSVTYGKIKWTYELDGYAARAPLLVSPDGTVYASAGDLYAIDSAGTLKWTYNIGVVDFNAGVAMSHDATCIYTQHSTVWDYYLASLDTSGAVNWELDIGSAPMSFSFSTPTVGSDSTIYFQTWEGKVSAINKGGTLKWAYRIFEDSRYTSATIGSGDTIYMAVRGDNTVRAIDSAGNATWTFSSGSGPPFSPITDAYGTVYVGFDDTLYAINTDGSVKWRFSAGAPISSSAAISSSGKLYFAAGNQFYTIVRTVIGQEENQIEQSRKEFLLDVCPNPFSRTTNIKLRIPNTGKQYVLSSKHKNGLAIYDVAGQLIRSFPIFDLQSPIINITWDGNDDEGKAVEAGVYFCRVHFGNRVAVKKVVLVQ